MDPRKALTDFEWKADREGSFKAVIATFNIVDKDGDVTLPGAFAPGMSVVLSPWGHTSMDGALPVGDAIVTSDGQRAYAEGGFYTDTPHGKAAYQTVKRLSEKGIQQWSYGYRVRQAGTNKKDLEPWPGARRVLKEVQPFEVSPVLIGAGEGVFTQSIKSEKAGDELLEQIAEEMTKYLNEAKAGATISRANWTRMHAAVSELMAFLMENNPDKEAKAAVDESAWDGNAAMTACDTAACYEAICAGKREGDPSLRQTWALPHHKSPGDAPNADGVRNSLSRLPQTQGLINKAAAQAHLERHMAAINPNAAKTEADPELVRIYERLQQEHDRTALMDLRWV